MDISDLIRTLEKLEEQKLISPREFLSSQGVEKASDLLSLYNKGLEYGIAQEKLLPLLYLHADEEKSNFSSSSEEERTDEKKLEFNEEERIDEEERADEEEGLSSFFLGNS